MLFAVIAHTRKFGGKLCESNLEQEEGIVQDQHNASLMKNSSIVGLEEAWQGTEISLCFVGSNKLIPNQAAGILHWHTLTLVLTDCTLFHVGV